MTPTVLPLVLRAAEESGAHHGPNPWLIGILVLGLLLGSLGALVAFGGGREHS